MNSALTVPTRTLVFVLATLVLATSGCEGSGEIKLPRSDLYAALDVPSLGIDTAAPDGSSAQDTGSSSGDVAVLDPGAGDASSAPDLSVVDTNQPEPDMGPAPGSLCAPCATPDDCGGQLDLCLANNNTGEVFCSIHCTSSSGCPADFLCADVGGIGQCVPESQTCSNPGTGPGPDMTTNPPTGEETGPLQGITEAHNVVRRATGAGMPDLVWDSNVAAFAQEWADELANRGCGLEHRPYSGQWEQQYGENIFGGSGTSWTYQYVVDAWASEESNYNYANNSCSGVCGHYTQIVWANSLRLGCATANCGTSRSVWVCNYDPPGNFNGQRPY